MKSKIVLICSIFSGLYLLFSCGTNREEEKYDPVLEYSQGNEFKLSIVNEKGQDLLTDKNFVGKISATGNLSKKTQTFSSVSWDKEGDLNFIDVNADKPDSRTMQPIITPTTKDSYGGSNLILKVDNTTTNLHCDFHYSNMFADKPYQYYGGVGIHLIKIKLNNGEEVAFNNHNRKLTLVYSNGMLSIKK